MCSTVNLWYRAVIDPLIVIGDDIVQTRCSFGHGGSFLLTWLRFHLQFSQIEASAYLIVRKNLYVIADIEQQRVHAQPPLEYVGPGRRRRLTRWAECDSDGEGRGVTRLNPMTETALVASLLSWLYVLIEPEQILSIVLCLHFCKPFIAGVTDCR